MTKGIFVRETTDIVGVGGEFATRYWIVATDDPETAEQAVRKMSAKSRAIEATSRRARDHGKARLGSGASVAPMTTKRLKRPRDPI
jgi:hypothetical protein